MLQMLGFYHNGQGWAISASKLSARMCWFVLAAVITIILHWKLNANIFNLIKKD